jgi:hypothetical protein
LSTAGKCVSGIYDLADKNSGGIECYRDIDENTGLKLSVGRTEQAV